jgi:hypothetical protein
VTITLVGFALFGVALPGCGETYCQSGPKYGTQCYDINSIEWQETQVRGETISERYAAGPSHPSAAPEVSPGCAVSANPNTGFYLMSGACSSRRQPAHGAVR